MKHAVALTAIAAALAVWTAILSVIARRERLRVTGVNAIPWFAVGCAAALGALALAVRPLPQACTCGVACVALAIAADGDARTGYLFDALTVPATAVVLALAFVSGSGFMAILGCASLVAIFGLIVAISRGRAMGLGDVKAMAAIGGAFGPIESLLAIVAACASGILEALLRGHFVRRAEIRFGPHLAVGAVVTLAWGEPFARYVVGASSWV